MGRADRGRWRPAAAGGPGLHAPVWCWARGGHLAPAWAGVAQGGGPGGAGPGRVGGGDAGGSGRGPGGPQQPQGRAGPRLGPPKARARALRVGLAEVERGKKWLAQHQRLVAEVPPLQDVMHPSAQRGTQDTAPDPDGGPGGQRLTKQVAPARRISLAEADMRHGRKSSATTFNGLQEHCVLDWDRPGTRAGVVRPANEPAPAAVELLVETLEPPLGLLQRAIDWGYRASPRRASPSWPAPGRKAGRSSPRTPAPWTVRTGPAPVRGARPSRWSRAKTPSCPPAPVLGVHRERRAPPPGAVQGEACIAVRTNRASPSSGPRSKPSADAPRGANVPLRYERIDQRSSRSGCILCRSGIRKESRRPGATCGTAGARSTAGRLRHGVPFVRPAS